jgi:protein TonB
VSVRGLRRPWPLSALQVALLVSLALHAGLLSLKLTDPARFERLFKDSPLEVILVNTRAPAKEPAPTRAQALAQTTLTGGGDARQGRTTSPLPDATRRQTGQGTEPLQQQISALQTQQSLMLSQVKKLLAQLPPTQAQEQNSAVEQQRKQLLNMLAEIEQRIQEENARPRKRYLSPSTREVAYAQYYDQLKRKIETLGTRNFPQRQGQKLYGSLTMIVTVDARGNVLSTEVVHSSGQPELDRSAQAIAAQAGPFGPFTAAMRRQADQLALVSRFIFSRDGDVLQTRLTGP